MKLLMFINFYMKLILSKTEIYIAILKIFNIPKIVLARVGSCFY